LYIPVYSVHCVVKCIMRCLLQVSIDLLLRSEAQNHDAEEAAHSVKVMLMKHIEPQLKTSVYYKTLNVVPAVSDLDGAKVLRVYFVYNRLCSVDGFLERVRCPLLFSISTMSLAFLIRL
jgi:hypothetical protein